MSDTKQQKLGEYETLFLKNNSGVAIPSLVMDQWLLNGELKKWEGPYFEVNSPIFVQGNEKPIKIGSYPMMKEKESIQAVEAAFHAYDYGRGKWPQMSAKDRIQHIEKFVAGLQAKKEEIANLLMWEICKTKADSEKEVVRTIQYIKDTIKELKDMENKQAAFVSDSGIVAQIRRTPYGVVLCSGPFNYPLNELYTTLIPALIMGNCVILKLPRVGVLCHYPTFELFHSIFPAGVINIVTGSGRTTMPAMMATGKVDIFAFIGTSTAADAVQKAHPKPHRLRVCLGLEAKNPAVVLPHCDIDKAVTEIILGSLSYNGQRCTAIKIVLVHEDIVDKFLPKLVAAVDNLKMGLPWEDGVKITPLPEEGKPGYLAELVADAASKGAKIINPRGGKTDRTFFAPAVLFPVNNNMRVWHEEQFGPVVPVTTFKTLNDIFDYLASSPYGQQASVFGSDPVELSSLIDVLVNQVSRVNINTQCQRGPDSMPFTGRKDSAYGTLSVYDALRVFSLRSLVATQDNKTNQDLIANILQQRKSNFLRVDYMF